MSRCVYFECGGHKYYVAGEIPAILRQLMLWAATPEVPLNWLSVILAIREFRAHLAVEA